MKQFLATILLMAGLSTSVNAADFSGSLGWSSDYIWRGVSQNANNPALHIDLAVEHEGWYLGTWASHTDLGMDNSYEYDFYGGYDMKLTDKLLVGGGFLQYNYNGGIEKVTELFVGGSYADMVELWYYVDHENSDLSYLDTKVKVPFISVVDLHLNYGKWKDGDDVIGFTLSKQLNDNFGINLMVLEEARHGKFMDSAALGFTYNF